jgi:hypothetical protein
MFVSSEMTGEKAGGGHAALLSEMVEMVDGQEEPGAWEGTQAACYGVRWGCG